MKRSLWPVTLSEEEVRANMSAHKSKEEVAGTTNAISKIYRVEKAAFTHIPPARFKTLFIQPFSCNSLKVNFQKREMNF